MTKTFRLIVKNYVLYFPAGGDNYDVEPVKRNCPDTPSILIRRYDTGNYDTTPWPLPRRKRADLLKRLAHALHEERQYNKLFPTEAVIELPDGTAFDFDAHLGAP